MIGLSDNTNLSEIYLVLFCSGSKVLELFDHTTYILFVCCCFFFFSKHRLWVRVTTASVRLLRRFLHVPSKRVIPKVIMFDQICPCINNISREPSKILIFFFFFFFFFIQFNVPFKIISLIETSQSIGGRNGRTPGKPPDTPASRTWLVSHVASAGLEPIPDTAVR